ncbi:acetolactate synthase-1/2/3 large subunit [Novosphingobium sp. GV055]|nr:acetolactate synthase-1/2/3 large subunit [Novosphingobium sp. GV055]PUB03572.1 acetolactate synthase-1/2/3 large subunit [Novosphingobium sp. GV061]PUB20027.1 acetolactate synthase-1/2/3 large subunit [Novosphingobium sp. GV079]PUB41788.1 acetolactate synthase-1/2/3 large subunit [Novosphingobium sp. GV027]
MMANDMPAAPALSDDAVIRTGADTLFDALHAGGARICFANPGTTEMTMVTALARHGGIRPVLSLFEGVCTGAADGYARVSGQVPLTLLHLGPGFANGIANLHNARRAGSRIVNIIGDHATWHLPYDAPLTSDITSLASPVSRQVIRMAEPGAIAHDVATAFAATRVAEGGAATLIVPTDVIDAREEHQDALPGSATVAPWQGARVDDAAVAAAAAALESDQGAIVLLGGNALTEAGVRAGAALAARLGGRLLMEPYPGIVTLGGDLPAVERQAYFPDDVIAQMGTARVVLAGARMPISYFGYEGWPSQLVAEASLVRLAGPEHDAIDALVRLGSALGVTGPAGAQPFTPATASANDPTAALTPAGVVEELLVQLPEHAIISLEGSTLGGPWLRNAHRACRHRVMTNTGGAIGQGLPCAVGAALAAPEARVVSLQSDGSAQYTLQALWTMAREKLPVTVILAANHRYAILQTELVRANAPLGDAMIEALTLLDKPKVDWVSLARGYGVEAVRVTTCGELAEALAQGLALDGPMLIQAELP